MRSLPGAGSDAGSDADTGAADPLVAAALASYECDGAGSPVLAALTRSRLLVPVVAVPGTDAETGAADTSADIAAVLMRGQDSRMALLAFTSLASMHSWDPSARPVPVSTADAARAAVQEGADAVVVDVGGPVMFVVESGEMEELAAGHVLARTSAGYAWLTGQP